MDLLTPTVYDLDGAARILFEEKTPMEKPAPYYETPVRYFSGPGPRNTQPTLEIVPRRANELNVRTVLVAS